MSDTPRTDAERVRFARLMVEWLPEQRVTALVPADFAAQLERELEAEKELVSDLVEALEGLMMDQVNGFLHGTETLRAAREAIYKAKGPA